MKIAVGLLLFLFVVLTPVWLRWTLGSGEGPPQLAPAGGTECVESLSFIRSSHMQLLSEWRNTAVREGNRVYVSTNGEQFTISLTETCLACHGRHEDFCDRCHDYVAVSADCWDCHLNTDQRFEQVENNQSAAVEGK